MAFVTWLDLLAVLASCCLSFFSYLLIFWKKGQAWDFPGGPPASLDGRAVWGRSAWVLIHVQLGDPTDCSPPGSSVHGICQARILEWVAISFSNAWKWKVKGKSLSCVRLLATPWTAAHQAPLSMGFARQEYWSGVPLPSLGEWNFQICIVIILSRLENITYCCSYKGNLQR